MNRDLNALDPLPKLGAKVQTEVVYYHQEEKEIKPHLYEKDGKLRYAPPLVSVATGQAGTLYECVTYGQEVTVADGQTFTLPPGFWRAVEEEKQDNKPDVEDPSKPYPMARVWVGGGKCVVADAEGWFAHTPGDPMPCEFGQRIEVRLQDGFKCTWIPDNSEKTLEYWSQKGTPIGSKVVAWKPA